MENKDDSESEIVQLVKYFKRTAYIDPSIADIIKIHSCNSLHTCKMEHEGDSGETEII